MKVSPVGHNSPLFCHIFGLNNALKDLADPTHFSPEIGATETFKKSPETTETMASLAREDHLDMHNAEIEKDFANKS